VGHKNIAVYTSLIFVLCNHSKFIGVNVYKHYLIKIEYYTLWLLYLKSSSL